MPTELTTEQWDALQAALEPLKPSITEPEPPIDPPNPEPEPPAPVAPIIGANPWKLDDYNNPNIVELASADVRFHDDRFTDPTNKPDNGPWSEAQFRIKLAPSHCRQVDPIVAPGEPESDHMHMWFGNTEVNQNSTGDTLIDHGDSTSQGRILNRSAYWIPAMLSGPTDHPNTEIIYPKRIIAYYKTTDPKGTIPIPVGLQLLAGNIPAGHSHPLPQIARATPALHWGPYDRGMVRDRRTTIPHDLAAGRTIRLALQYPNLIRLNNQGQPILSSPGFNHYTYIHDSEPVPEGRGKIPTLSMLFDWIVDDDIKHWRLASDLDADTASIAPHPGGSAHGDVIFAWHPDTQNTWRQGCYIGPNGARNCTNGQTGTNRQLNRYKGELVSIDQATHNVRVPLHHGA